MCVVIAMNLGVITHHYGVTSVWLLEESLEVSDVWFTEGRVPTTVLLIMHITSKYQYAVPVIPSCVPCTQGHYGDVWSRPSVT